MPYLLVHKKLSLKWSPLCQQLVGQTPPFSDTVRDFAKLHWQCEKQSMSQWDFVFYCWLKFFQTEERKTYRYVKADSWYMSLLNVP
uniref:Uncharacterized protein n=1 Tax=Arundo donax TaxID=35708 RepID=A0A0A9HIU4_ARUDO